MSRHSPLRRSRTESPCGRRCGCERFRALMSSENCCGACPFLEQMRPTGAPDEVGVIRDREVELHWRASQLTRAIATCAGVALAAAVIGGHWQLIAFTAPLLGVLCSISWQHPVPRILVHGEPDSQRCFEDEQVHLKVWATEESSTESGPVAVELTVSAVAGMQLEVLDSDSLHAKTVAAVAQ